MPALLNSCGQSVLVGLFLPEGTLWSDMNAELVGHRGGAKCRLAGACKFLKRLL